MNHILRGGILAVFIVLLGDPLALHGESLPIKYESPADKALAVVWLGKLKSDSAVPLLIRLCDDKDGAVRMSAAVALGEIKDAKAATILTKLANDPTQASVKGVISFEPERFWDSQGGFYTYDYPVQNAAQLALLKLPPATPDPPQFIAQAMAVLRNLDRKSLDRLNRKIQGKPDAIVKYYATQEYKTGNAIYTHGYEAMDLVNLYAGPEATKALAAALGCGSENLELMAARDLAGRNKEEVLPLIHDVLKKPGLTPLTLTACLAVLDKLDPAAANAVARRLVERYQKADDHEWLRMPYIASPQLLASLTGEDMPLLTTLLANQTAPARRDAITGIMKRIKGGLPPPDELTDMEDIPQEKQNEAIGLFLQQLNKPEADWTTFKASYELGRLKVKSAVPGLLREIEHPSRGSYVLYKNTASYYQQMAGWALTQIADPASIPPLRKIAQDEEKQFVGDRRVTRIAAILAYARLAGKDAINDLAAILNENDVYISNSLHSTSHDILLPREEEAAFPSLSRVQDAAACGLADIGGEDARKVLVDYMNNGRPLTWLIVKSIFRLDPKALDAWSMNTLKSDPSEERNIAVAIRFSCFMDTTADLAHGILKSYASDSMASPLVLFLQRKSLSNATVTQDLINALSEPRSGADVCRSRLDLIEAIGRQGGPEAERGLMSFADSGGIKPH